MLRVGLLKRMAAHLPLAAQNELRRHFFRRQIRQGTFRSGEKEFALLGSYVCAGDFVLDLGANVGHYTLRLSSIVGPTGHVVALEPVPETFALLSANVRFAPHRNITLLNIAASDASTMIGMDIPEFTAGLSNLYMARVAVAATTPNVLALPIDTLALPRPVRLVKIDIEGHEEAALRGMRRLLERDHPILIVETDKPQVPELLRALGYSVDRLAGSSNVVALPRGGERPASVAGARR